MLTQFGNDSFLYRQVNSRLFSYKSNYQMFQLFLGLYHMSFHKVASSVLYCILEKLQEKREPPFSSFMIDLQIQEEVSNKARNFNIQKSEKINVSLKLFLRVFQPLFLLGHSHQFALLSKEQLRERAVLVECCVLKFVSSWL